jgi:carbonic anhydrase
MVRHWRTFCGRIPAVKRSRCQSEFDAIRHSAGSIANFNGRQILKEELMNTIDEALKANETYAKSYDSALGRPPTPRLAIVTCMDPRLTNILQALGLGAGDADVIRNAGSAITEDSLRSLLVSTRVLGSQEIMIINHTDCGMTTFKDEELDAKLQKLTGTAAVEPARFYSFTNTDLEENTREQVQKVKSHPWIPKHIPIRGFVFDVHTSW